MKDKIIALLLERGFEPVDITALLFDDSPGNWAVEFPYQDKDGRWLTETVGRKTLIVDCWWLDEEVVS